MLINRGILDENQEIFSCGNLSFVISGESNGMNRIGGNSMMKRCKILSLVEAIFQVLLFMKKLHELGIDKIIM